MEVNNLPIKDFKAIIINMLNRLRRMDEHSENFKKELENIQKNPTELKNAITK